MALTPAEALEHFAQQPLASGVDLVLYGALHRRDHTRLRSLPYRTTGRSVLPRVCQLVCLGPKWGATNGARSDLIVPSRKGRPLPFGCGETRPRQGHPGDWSRILVLETTAAAAWSGGARRCARHIGAVDYHRARRLIRFPLPSIGDHAQPQTWIALGDTTIRLP